MIDNLYLYNFDIKSQAYNNAGIFGVENNNGPYFILKTCQRLLLVTHGAPQLDHSMSMFNRDSGKRTLFLKGSDAYQYILEVLCGLQSQLLGENEIVGQFKSSLQSYSLNPVKNRNLGIILEKLLHDAKDIRTKYLSHVGQSTYASIAKKIIGKSDQNVLIIGTGHMALDLLQSLKKSYSLILCARNQSKLDFWQQTATFKTLPWFNQSLIMQCPIILNTVGVPNFKLLGVEFFNEWSSIHAKTKSCFIDFGSPSSVEYPSTLPHPYTLQDLFSQGSQLDLVKLTKIEEAKRAIEQTVLKRALWLDQKFNRDQTYNFAASI